MASVASALFMVLAASDTESAMSTLANIVDM
jgi:hypothetical protein